MKLRIRLLPQDISAVLTTGNNIVAQVWSGSKEPTMEQVEAHAELFARAPQLRDSLEEMCDLVDDILMSNNIAQLCFQDYQRLNEAPGRAKAALKGLK